MNHEMTHNLFSNFQSTVFRAVKTFLQKNKGEETDKSITTSLRIPGEIKEFYECIAEAEMTSINTAIVSTLSKVKDQTISEYQKSYSSINDTYDYQINSFFKIIDDQKIDYNDLCMLLEWITGIKINRADITNKEILVNLIDKNAQLKTCKIFGYSYEWLQDNKRSISYKWPGFKDRWYKHVKPFVRDLIISFYLDETVESFELSFLCCDSNVINNISSGISSGIQENITPIVIANRCINGIKTSTYHRFESNNINYEKCRHHFIVLIKMILVLVKNNIISFPCGYLVTPQQHDMILDGSMHLAELFNKNRPTNDFNVDDLEDVEIRPISVDDNHRTNKPHIYHCLNSTVIHNILTLTDKATSSMPLTDDVASRCGMNKAALAKYLRLFDINNNQQYSNGVFLSPEKNDVLIINLIRIREIQSELHECKTLDTAFG
jgi:hypothetical protein